jgi:GNAT superfamily N-acetyltransferase
MHLEFKILSTTECEAAYNILKTVGTHMHETQKLSHWYGSPITLEKMRENLHKWIVYGVFYNNIMVATFTLQEEQPDYYEKNQWSDNTAKSIYLKRLAILPEYQNCGIGKKCLDFIVASHHGFWLRLDARQANTSTCEFYRKYGFTNRGDCTAINHAGTWLCTAYEFKAPPVSKL